MRTFRLLAVIYFYPRPPRGGRLLPATITEAAQEISIHALREEGDSSLRRSPKRRRRFLSTPSARRATEADDRAEQEQIISIHALREEGDLSPYGAAHEHQDFYPRPPRGGRLRRLRQGDHSQMISIHALREEGDATASPRPSA